MHYLGHVISESGVTMHSAKVESIKSRPRPASPRGLQGFLSLAGYYMWFIKDFGTIAAPLTTLIRKDNFTWFEAVTLAFSNINQALSSSPILHLPNLEQQFIMDCDASG